MDGTATAAKTSPSQVDGRPVLRWAVPVLIVIAGMLALELAYDVALGDGLIYMGYELVFIIAPGWLVYRALAPEPGSALRQLAMGWALGYVLEILSFMFTAATGTRSLLVLYPVVFGAAAAAMLYRARGAGRIADRDGSGLTGLGVIALTGLGLGVVAAFATVYFLDPLPGTEGVSYFQDDTWHLSLAADVKHHWPLLDPNISGEPLPYHYFAHLHIAAASQITGLDLPLVYFRLFPLPMIILSVLQFAVAGRTLVKGAGVGLVAAALFFFVGPLTLETHRTQLFPGDYFALLITSPSLLLGLVLFLPMIILLGEQLAGEARSKPIGAWVLIALFAVGVSDTKVVVLPLLLAALGLYALWAWLTTRRIPVAVWLSGVLLAVAAGVLWLLQYRGHSSGLVLDPSLRYFNDMVANIFVRDELEGWLPDFLGRGVVLTAGSVVVGALALFSAQLVGLAWIAHHQRWRLEPRQAWLGSLLAVGLLVVLLVTSPGTGNYKYFLFYGIAAGCLLSAQGLWIAWGLRPRLAEQTGRVIAIAVATAVALALLIAAPRELDLFSGKSATADTIMFWYGGLALILLALYLCARRWTGPSRWTAAALVCAAILALGALDTPINKVRPAFDGPSRARESGRRLTPDLYKALTYLRTHAPRDAVIAVNNQEALEFNYAAFAERRTFFGGWGYSLRTRENGYEGIVNGLPLGAAGRGGIELYASRAALNDDLFMRGSRSSLDQMVAGYGVRYLLIDSINGYPSDVAALVKFGRPVFSAPGALVLEVPENAARS